MYTCILDTISTTISIALPILLITYIILTIPYIFTTTCIYISAGNYIIKLMTNLLTTYEPYQ